MTHLLEVYPRHHSTAYPQAPHHFVDSDFVSNSLRVDSIHSFSSLFASVVVFNDSTDPVDVRFGPADPTFRIPVNGFRGWNDAWAQWFRIDKTGAFSAGVSVLVSLVKLEDISRIDGVRVTKKWA